MTTPLKIVFIIVCWVGYYFINKILNVDEEINSYTEKIKSDGNYNENSVERYKKYLNLKCISGTIAFIAITIIIFILEFTKINDSLIELIIAASIGKIVLVIGDKIIDKKMPLEKDINMKSH